MKKILVVGASGGMGRAICNRLLIEGYEVFGMDILKQTPNPNVHYLSVDITKMENIQEAYRVFSPSIDTLYAIIHVAGIYAMDSLLEIKEEKIIKIFNINVFGIYRVNQVFASLLKKGSRIVITSSEVAPLDPLPFNGIYSITKSTLEKYAYSLRMEMNLLGIRVSILRPGAVKTTLLNHSISELDQFCMSTKLYQENSKKFKMIVDRIEAKSVSPERLARVALRAIKAKRPRYIYSVNRNFLLKLFNILPHHLQVWLIGKLLRKEKRND